MHITRSLKKIFLLFFCLTLCFTSFAAAQTDDLYAVFQQPATRTEGQAYLEITPFSTPVRPSYVSFDPDVPLWQIGLFLEETNGVPMTLSAVTFVRFDAEHNVLANVCFEGDELPAAGIYFTALMPNEAQMITDALPLDSTAEYGLIVEGIDDNGHDVRFTTLIPLSQELIEPLSVDAFRAEGEGDALITLTPSANPVYAQENSFFGNGIGWLYDVAITNTSDVPVSLDQMTLIYFDEAGNISFQYYLGGGAIADWLYMPSNVLAAGETYTLSDMSPMQPLQGVGYQFAASTEDGRAQTIQLFVALSQEMKAE